MLTNASRVLRNLRKNKSGNAMVMVAMAMPALIGGTGLAVDTAQWFMWKREMQYAVDQAALAGAWARSDTSTQSSYETRAKQEYSANLSKTSGFASTPNISLANWAGGNLNSVVVSASGTKSLPFSSFLTQQSTTVNVTAQATFAAGTTFTSCLIAVNETISGAITIGGNSVLTAGCGMAALSTSTSSVTVTGNPDIDSGFVLSAGGIDDWFDTHTDDQIHEYLSGLYDPFASLSPPNPTESQVTRTYTCTPGTTTTTATYTERVQTTYAYRKGKNQSSATAYAGYPQAKDSSDITTGPTPLKLVPNGTTAGTFVTGPSTTTSQVGTSGGDRIYEDKTVTTTKTYADVLATTTATQASLNPGTYTDLKISCKTVFATGVYIIDGGGLEIDGQYEVTGASVMFVLKNGAYIKINGGSNVNLTAISASDLIARGVSEADASKLAGMLVFEDRSSPGTLKNNINGNTNTVLNGTIYLPKSAIDFSGTASVTSQCLMIAANTIKITGTANMTTFCPAGSSEDTVVASTDTKVRLVA